jgi:hypothetical protein
LALWWWFLLTPVLAGMRAPAEFALGWLPGYGSEVRITAEPGGNWSVAAPVSLTNAPLQDAVENAVRGLKDAAPNAPRRIRSVRAVFTRASLSVFCLSVPLYWAILLAAPRGKRRLRAALAGTALAAITGFLSLLLFLITSIDVYVQFVRGPVAQFALNLGSYMGQYLLPYAAPLLIAIWLDAEFRDRILSMAAPGGPPVRVERQPAGRAGSGAGRKRVR